MSHLRAVNSILMEINRINAKKKSLIILFKQSKVSTYKANQTFVLLMSKLKTLVIATMNRIRAFSKEALYRPWIWQVKVLNSLEILSSHHLIPPKNFTEEQQHLRLSIILSLTISTLNLALNSLMKQSTNKTFNHSNFSLH